MRLYVKLLAHSKCSNYSGLYFFFPMYFIPSMSQKMQGWVRHAFCPRERPPDLVDGQVHPCLGMCTPASGMCQDAQLWRLHWLDSSALEQGSQCKILKGNLTRVQVPWRTIGSFLESSDYMRCGSLPADGGSQDTGLSPRNQPKPSATLGMAQPVTHSTQLGDRRGEQACLRALLQFQVTYIPPSPSSASRTVKNSSIDQRVLINFSQYFFY